MTMDAIDTHIGRVLGRPFRRQRSRPLGGGDINRAAYVADERAAFFVKTNRRERLPMFEAEAAALQALRRCAALRVPEPVCWGEDGECAYLVLEYIALRPLDQAGQRGLGDGLAALHHITAPRHGFACDNTIGTTSQPNRWHTRWADFWRHQRLAHQFQLARRRGDRALARAGEALLGRLDDLLAGHAPEPSLLHGDLWAGNAAGDERGRPVIFDPASYYGDRETDLAMMELFGGFSAALAAYRAAWPVDAGYTDRRRGLYQLYHLLNHFNLFGGGYGARAREVARALLAQVR